ncbi:MAG: ThiF family adenylyltransferase, partial [Methanobrevibacter sp.]|nr:ThiF family adenylyltransferase [Methanobrevibacter sp.]
MEEKFSRTEMLIGNEGMKKLKEAKVAIFGLGGVGSFVCEGLARSGIGNFILVDFDKVDESNINRQLIATTKTIGEYKVDLMRQRI